MAQLPIMPVNIPLLTADTVHMTTEQYGAYRKILDFMWLQGARLDYDELQLMRIAGLSLKKWRSSRRMILKPFTIEGGIMTQKRMMDIWLRVQESRRKRAEAANRRWNRPPIKLFPK